jgi:hypothetical protein
MCISAETNQGFHLKFLTATGKQLVRDENMGGLTNEIWWNILATSSIDQSVE